MTICQSNNLYLDFANKHLLLRDRDPLIDILCVLFVQDEKK